ncbi:MAG: hypothetical protein M1835_007370 [Candelina submexicana]|nr:MAG: hypothetical protein M1835_007370 [Candelina submexicana]
MTSISQQPILPPQAPNTATATQSTGPAHSSNSSIGGTTSPLAAAPAPATARSYANATRKPFSPPTASNTASSSPALAVGSSAPAQHGRNTSLSSVNSKGSVLPAVPTIVNSTNVVNGSSASNDHNRNPSVTISAAAPSGYMPNGNTAAGPPSGPSSIQFGSVSQSSQQSSLPVASPNPRISSPATSPSPIPQPAASGGRPPSGLQGQGNALNFGSIGVESGEVHQQLRSPHVPQSSLAPGPQPSHLRRESSQSSHSDMSNPSMNAGPSRGNYPSQGGRGGGRGFGQPYQPQAPSMHSPNPSFRAMSNQQRGGPSMGPPYQGQGRQLNPPFMHSPHQGVRSPALTNSHPGTPNMQQVPIAGSYMPYGSYGGYPSQMGPPQVNSPSSSFVSPELQPRQTQKKQQSRRQEIFHQDLFHTLPTPNLSPDNSFFETYLMLLNQGQHGIPQFDPNFTAFYPQQHPMHPQQMQFMGGPPGSPRQAYHMPPGQQHYVPGQYATPQQPPPMSRTSSSVSNIERPSSSLGPSQAPPMTPSTSQSIQPSRSTNSPAQPSNFKIPTRGKAVKIQDPATLAIKDFKKSPASPAPVPRSPVIVSSTSNATPPPRSSSRSDLHHTRSESVSVKTEEEKKNDMRDAVAKKIEADKAEEKRRREEDEQKAAQAKEAAAKEKEEAEKVKREAEEKAQKAKDEAEQAKKDADEQKQKEAEAKEQKAKEDAEQAKKDAEEKARLEEEEEEIRLMEEEARKEEEAEERFRQKKMKEKEEQAKKEAEAAANAEENIRKAEREAEEAEEARLKQRAEGESSESKAERVNLFAALKSKSGPDTVATPVTALSTPPQDTGTSTPISDDSMGPPLRSASGGKPKPAALKLETAKSNSVEPPQPSAALQSLRSARFIDRINDVSYPGSVSSPNPSLNATAPAKKFKYETNFLLQFKEVFSEKPSIDWDSKIRETVGDTSVPTSARTPATMGPRNPSGRQGLPNFASFGNFQGGAGGKTLPPGTTSQERYEASTRAQSRPTMNNPLAQFAGRPGGFQMGTPMIRTGSTTSLQGQGVVPQSPRMNTSHRSQRGDGRGSKRGNASQQGGRNEAEAARTMPITANQELAPLQISISGWKPLSVGKGAATGAAGPAPGGDGAAHMPPDMVQRKVKSNLNKMTPEKFDKISDQILDIVAQSKNESDGRTLRQVIQLTFEKATDEAHWASMYAKFCKRMLETMSPDIKDENIRDKSNQIVTGGNLFRKYLLNRCQEEFEQGWKVNLPEKPEGVSEEAAMLSEEYYIAAAAKRRGLGLVQFIGELYKLGMLTERIMHECVRKLVDYTGIPDEAEVESLTKLLRTIGRNLDSTEKGKPMMDVYFTRITAMMETPGLPSRLKFMLLDTVDLRRGGWATKEGDKGPKTLDQVREEAAQAQQAKDMEKQRQNQRGGGGGGGGGGGRMPMGRGDARSFSGGGQFGAPPPDYHKNTVGRDDLLRLGNKASSRQASQGPLSLGPTSMFASRSSSGRKPLAPSGLSRAGEDSGASSRTATPPQQKDKEASTSANAFSALAGLDASGEPNDSASPPSAHSSPPTSKSKPSEGRSKSPAKDKDQAGAP